MMSKKNRELVKIFTGFSNKFPLGTILVLGLFVSQLDNANGQDANNCVGKPNGWKYQDPLDCHGYFVCYQQKPLQTYCDHYEKFDEINKQCVIGKCPPCKKCETNCPGTPSTPTPPACSCGDMWRDPNDCAQYYACIGGVITLRKCTAGLQFNTQTNTCDYKENVKCGIIDPTTPSTPSTPPPGSCQGRLHGDMWRNPNDCSQFYVCSWGVLTLHQCPAGLQFNNIQNVCDYSQNVDCNKNLPTTPPATPGPPPNPCYGRPHGDMWRDSNDCGKYYKCSCGAITSYKCSAGLLFNLQLKSCDYSYNVDCHLPDGKPCFGLPDGQVWGDINDCQQYYVCSSGVIKTNKCGLGLLFNKQKLKCDYSNNVDCGPTLTPPTPPTPPGSCQGRLNGDMWRNPNDCSQFYVCSWGVLELQKCPAGLQFNNIQNVCDYNQYVDCNKNLPTTPPATPGPPPNPCYGRPHGDMWRDSNDCGKYYKCSCGAITSYKCSAGLLFNLQLKSCDYSYNVDCHLPDGKPCLGLPDGQVWGDINDCQQYYVCSSGVIKTNKCGSGLLFNKQKLVCDYSKNVDCGSITPVPTLPTTPGTQYSCSGIPHGQVWANANDCQQYYICSFGVIKSNKCGSGLLFNKQKLVCDYSNNVDCGSITPVPTLPTTPGTQYSCSGIPHGQVWANANDCQQYYICSFGVIKSNKCGSGLLFNKQKLVCDYSKNVDCGPITPVPTLTPTTTPTTQYSCWGIPNGQVWADANDCQQYYICSSGVIKQNKCGSGLLFNKQKLVCDYSKNVDCGAITPVPTLTPTTTPATQYSCSGIPHGQVWANANDCQQYYICSFGVIKTNKCGSGLLFNKQKLVCDYSKNVDCGPITPVPTLTPTTTPATQYSCSGIPHGQVWADANDCQQYYICSFGVIKSNKCGSGLLFNKQKLVCDYSKNVDCGAITPATPNSNDCDGKYNRYAFADPSDCSRYFVCAGGLKLPGQCISGYYFDQKIMGCVPKDRVQCGNQPLPTPTPKPMLPPCPSCENPCRGLTGYVLYRDPTNCAKVIICNAGKPISYECPAGKFFDLAVGACAMASSVNCVPVPTAPTPTPGTSNSCQGITGNTVIRDPNNCANFIVCNQGSSKLYSCPTGKYFDLKIGACNTANLVDCRVGPVIPTPTPKPPGPSPPYNPCDALTGYALFRDPTNCARVFIFQKGVLTPYDCPSGKFFDLKTSTCANSELVDCSGTVNLPTSATPSPVNPTTRPQTTTTAGGGQGDLNTKDCLGKPNGTRFRSPTHCRVYYTCRNSEAIQSSCPVGQWFDEQAFVCNFSYMVNCPAKVN